MQLLFCSRFVHKWPIYQSFFLLLFPGNSLFREVKALFCERQALIYGVHTLFSDVRVLFCQV